MSNLIFGLSQNSQRQALYHYKACGLDNVYLADGFNIEKTEYGEGISIQHIDELHKAIGLNIIENLNDLTPKEFKFLRTELNLTQAALAQYVGVSDQAIARYEKGETAINKPVARLLAIIYGFHCLPKAKQDLLLKKLEQLKVSTKTIDKNKEIIFSSKAGNWTTAQI